MRLQYTITAALLAVALTQAASAQTVAVSAVTGDLTPWGTENKEVYSVAMHLDKEELTGKKVEAIRIPVLEADYYLNPCVWVATELEVQDNAPVTAVKVDAFYEMVDEVSGATTIYLRGNLPQPYAIPAEGLYVGCTFEIPKIELEREASLHPVLTAATTIEGSFWFQGSRSCRQWKDMYVAEKGIGCALQALVSGEFDSSLGIVSVGDVPVVCGDSYTIPITIEWRGSGTIYDFDYTLKQNGETTTGHQVWTDTPSTLVYGAIYDIPLELTAGDEPGDVATAVTITAVNGQPIAPTSGECTVAVVPFFPRRQSVMEEYTGLTCAWCVKGIAGIRRMESLYGEQFVAIAIHNADPMETISTADYPNFVSGFPYCYINRTYGADPYNGYELATFGIDKVWDEACRDFTPWSLEMSLSRGQYEGDVDVAVSASCVRSLSDHGYRLSVMLTGDGITDPAWAQLNGVSGRGGEYGGDTEELDYFVDAPKAIHGLEFNDVALMYSSLKGDEGSIPEDVEMLVPVEYSYTFETLTQPLAAKASALNVVALVTDAEGRVANCVKGLVPPAGSTETYSYSGLDSVEQSSADAVAVEWFDLQGRAIATPARTGLYILRTTYVDGRVDIRKIIR